MGKPEGIPRLGWAIAFLGTVSLIAFAYSNLKSIQPPTVSSRLAPIAAVPDFQLIDESGKPFALSDLKGKIWVANFIFTRCKGPCPLISSRMSELNKAIARAGKGVDLVSFTVDPENDTPEVLAAYASGLGADPARWKFLTGEPEAIDSIVVKGLLQPLAREADGTPAHSQRFVLVDRTGQLRGFEDGNDPEVVQKLLMDIGELLRENSPSQK